MSPLLNAFTDGDSCQWGQFVSPSGLIPFRQAPSTFVQKLNSILLEHAIFTDAIVHKSKQGLYRALKAYLEGYQPRMKWVVDAEHMGGFKDVPGPRTLKTFPEMHRRAYLRMLHRIAEDIVKDTGGKCVINVTKLPLKSIIGISRLPDEFDRIYRKLGELTFIFIALNSTQKEDRLRWFR
jgi:hypothetical protein